MRIGVIFCAYQANEYVDQSLAAWVAFRRENPDMLICAVSVRFAGFEGEDDGTQEILKGYLDRGEIDYVIDDPNNIPETAARGMALQWLKSRDVEVTWLVDADEFYSLDNINRIIDFTEDNPWVAWFRLSLKNYVFDPSTYLTEPFQPPRIHRIEMGGYRAHSFNADNDILYGGTVTRDLISQDQFASLTIPQDVAWVKHLTWQNDLRSKRKIEYQLKGRGWPQCSFAWDENKGLIFNPVLLVPRIARDS